MLEKVQRQINMLIVILKKALNKDKQFVITVYDRELVVNFILNVLALGKSQLKHYVDTDFSGKEYVHWSLKSSKIPISPNVSRLFCEVFQESQEIVIKSMTITGLRIFLPKGVTSEELNINDNIETLKQFLLDYNFEFELSLCFHYLSDKGRDTFYHKIVSKPDRCEVAYPRLEPIVTDVSIKLNPAKPDVLLRRFYTKKVAMIRQHNYRVRKNTFRQYKNYVKINDNEYLFYNALDACKERREGKEVTLLKITNKNIITFTFPQCIHVYDIQKCDEDINKFLVECTDYLVLERVDRKILMRPVTNINTKEYSLTIRSGDKFSFNSPLKLRKVKMPTLYFDVKRKEWIMNDSMELLFCGPVISLLYHQSCSKHPDEYFSTTNLEVLQDVALHYLSFCIRRVNAALDDLKKGKTPDTFVDFSSLSKKDISLLLS